MKHRKYTKKTGRFTEDLRKADWEQRLNVVRLHNQGWNFSQIARFYGISRQAISQKYKLISRYTIQELEQISKQIYKTKAKNV